MPIICSHTGCMMVASKRKVCCGQSYCQDHANITHVCNDTVLLGTHATIEKLESTMLNLPKSKHSLGENNLSAKKQKLVGKRRSITNHAHTLLNACNQLFKWWPYILTTLKVACMCVVMTCMSRLQIDSIMIYGCVKTPLVFLEQVRSKSKPGMSHTHTSKLYNTTVACILFTAATLCELYFWTTASKIPIIAASQYLLISAVESYRSQFGQENESQKPMIGDVMNQGVSLIKQNVVNKMIPCYGLCIDITSCFVIPAIVYANFSYISMRMMVGLICATILY